MSGVGDLQWKVVVPPPATFSFVEGQFDDAREEEDGTPQNNEEDRNKKNLEKLFHTKLDLAGGGSNLEEYYGDEEGEEEEDSGLDDDDDDDFEFLGEKGVGVGMGPNSQISHDQASSEELFKRYVSRIKVEKYEGVDQLPSGAGNKIISSAKKMTANRQKVKDKQDRATVEQVMDPRTRMILYKLLSSGKIVSIDGCISTGKEANVYHATGPEQTSYAIKIFKTSILTFKTRDKYVTGEFRFRQGYCKKNPRKMVRVWAEKEFRNLLRIHSSGKILVPQPKLLKSHVLVMDFIGSDGWPCPLLKDVKFEHIEFEENLEDPERNPLEELLKKLYRDSLIILYQLYKNCKLVHADFSEFNLILKDNRDLYVIDVSQSVEHDHPRSFDFLRSDIKNVQDFFGKNVLVGDFKEIFEFITSPTVDNDNFVSKLDDILSRAKKWENLDVTTEVFRQTYIPRKMEEVEHFERDYEKVKKGETELVYTSVMGMKADLSGPTVESIDKSSPGVIDSSVNQDDDNEESDDRSESDDSQDEDGESKEKHLCSARPKDETPEQRKERKKLVKQERAEKRQTKVKKHVKKRAEKLSHHNSKRK